MVRLSVLGLAAAFGAVFPALAADGPGDSPAIQLLRNGIAGSGNMAAAGLKAVIVSGEFNIDLRRTTLADVIGTYGAGMAHRVKDGESAFAWVCYVTPDTGEASPRVLWFTSDEAKGQTDLVTGVAMEYAPDTVPASCTALPAPADIDTGYPSLSHSQADIDAALNKGQPGQVEPDGTSSWTLDDAEPVGDGINVRSTELKYRVENGRVIAASARVVTEME